MLRKIIMTLHLRKRKVEKMNRLTMLNFRISRVRKEQSKKGRIKPYRMRAVSKPKRTNNPLISVL
jgi:hypothetical protein